MMSRNPVSMCGLCRGIRLLWYFEVNRLSVDGNFDNSVIFSSLTRVEDIKKLFLNLIICSIVAFLIGTSVQFDRVVLKKSRI